VCVCVCVWHRFGDVSCVKILFGVWIGWVAEQMWTLPKDLLRPMSCPLACFKDVSTISGLQTGSSRCVCVCVGVCILVYWSSQCLKVRTSRTCVQETKGKRNLDDAQFRKWARDQGVVSCPTCKAVIQKEGQGVLHVLCLYLGLLGLLAVCDRRRLMQPHASSLSRCWWPRHGFLLSLWLEIGPRRVQVTLVFVEVNL
jgi:hypothetical protein